MRVVAVVLVVLALLAAGLVGALVLMNRGSNGTPAATSTLTGPPIGEPSGGTAGTDIVTVPISTANDPFSPPVGEGQTVPVAPVTTPTVVKGGQTGLYGGTMDKASCDRDKLIGFLTENEAKATAWADVEGIAVAEIPTFIKGLTSMLLRADTIVINHGYVDGKATPFTSVLQAGTAVLVDDYGNPRVRCYCGNPLKPAPTTIEKPVYSGPTWPAWNPQQVIVVVPNPVVVPIFVVIDVSTGDPFTRPPGSDGAEDTPGASASPQPQPSGSGRPTGAEEKIFSVESIQGVMEKPTKPSTFGIEQDLFVTKIVTYHYNNGGTGPGTIGLKASDGTMYGPWQATGSEGQGGVANAYWTVTPDITLPPGQYTVVDSDPSTWSWASDTGGKGIVIVSGIWASGP